MITAACPRHEIEVGVADDFTAELSCFKELVSDWIVWKISFWAGPLAFIVSSALALSPEGAEIMLNFALCLTSESCPAFLFVRIFWFLTISAWADLFMPASYWAEPATAGVWYKLTSRPASDFVFPLPLSFLLEGVFGPSSSSSYSRSSLAILVRFLKSRLSRKLCKSIFLRSSLLKNFWACERA